MKTSPLSSLLLLAIWPTTVVVQAFASSTTTSLSSLSHHGKNKKSSLPSPPKSFVQKHQPHHKAAISSSSSSSHLNLFGSNHAAAAATAVTNLIPRGGGGGGITNTVSSWASTPNGSFNLALGVLAASTAILKVYNRVDSDKDDDGAAVVRKKHQYCFVLDVCGFNFICRHHLFAHCSLHDKHSSLMHL